MVYDDLRVLDLAGEMGTCCGKLLADLDVEVVKVEPPGGHRSRRLGALVGDDPPSRETLHWFQFNPSKKSFTMDIRQGSRNGNRRGSASPTPLIGLACYGKV